MLPRHEIIAWREHANWSRDAQIEQDVLLTRAMVAIFRDPFLSEQVAMRGGTVLHKVHLAPASRYSEDIDLVLVGPRPISHVRKGLARVLQPVLGAPILDVLGTIQLAVRNAVRPSSVARMTFAYAPTTPPPARMTIKVEVNYTEREPFYSIVDLPYHPPLPELDGPVMLRSYDLDEMLGTKLRALLQRTQGRDLYDLDHALSHSPADREPPNPERITSAFADYMLREGTHVTRADFERALDQKLASVSFRGDMAAMLPAGHTFDADAAAARVRSLLLSHLPQS
jgi:predicted nucleotidyltransferase component of viral defense system